MIKLFCSLRVFNHYKNVAKQMIKAGLAKNHDGGVILTLPAKDTLFFDAVLGNLTIPMGSSQIVLIKKDGTPGYHFSSVIDDIDCDINFILRGADHLANTPRQIFLARTFALMDYPDAQKFIDACFFGHVGLITKDKNKLSKRDADSNALHLASYPKKAIIHWITQLGWGHPLSTFDKDFSRFNDFKFFLDGALRGPNMDINLQKLDHLKKVYQNDFSSFSIM